jgi:ketosteroid isomerase-like protein
MTDEEVVRQRIEHLAAAIRAKDRDAIQRIYGEDIVSFDVEPPLTHVGVADKLANWDGLFARYASLEYEVRELQVTTSGDVAFAHSLNRIGGTLHEGTQASHWIRCTNCLRRIDGDWRVVHDHVSVPFEMASGKALVDLAP